MRRVAADLEVGDAHHRDALDVEADDVRSATRPRAARRRAPSPCLRRSCASIVDAASSSATAAGDAHDRRLAAPALGQLLRGRRRLRDRRLLRQRLLGQRRADRIRLLLGRRRLDVVGTGRDRATRPLIASLIRSIWAGAEDAAGGVVRGELQSLQRDLVVVGRQRALLQQLLGVLERLVGIAGEHALVEVLGRAQRRPVAEQHVEEFEPLDMAAEHDEAEGQRRRDQEQADRPPQPGPEDRRDDDREGRQAGALAVDERLDDVAHERLGDEEQGQPSTASSTSRDRRRRRAAIGSSAGDEGADIGHEAHQRRRGCPTGPGSARR